MSNGIPISKEQFQHLDTVEAKLDALFEVSEATLIDIKTLKKRKKVDTTVAGAMGLVGGFAAMMGKWVVGR